MKIARAIAIITRISVMINHGEQIRERIGGGKQKGKITTGEKEGYQSSLFHDFPPLEEGAVVGGCLNIPAKVISLPY
jgi:hypothetical protein